MDETNCTLPKNGMLTNDKKEEEKVERQLAYFFIKNKQFYKKGFTLSSLCSLHSDEANYVLREIHENICEIHLVGTSLAIKVVYARYYWPHMKKDAIRLAQHCDKCQRFAKV